MRNCTITGNIANGSGGGFWANNYLELFNLTIAFNRAKNGNGGGVHMEEPQSAVTDACIVAKNTHGNVTQIPDDYNGAPHGGQGDLNRSLFGTRTGAINLYPGDIIADPLLGSLRSNGGPTKTLAIGTNSPAYRKADPTSQGSRGIDQEGSRGAQTKLGISALSSSKIRVRGSPHLTGSSKANRSVGV